VAEESVELEVAAEFVVALDWSDVTAVREDCVMAVAFETVVSAVVDLSVKTVDIDLAVESVEEAEEESNNDDDEDDDTEDEDEDEDDDTVCGTCLTTTSPDSTLAVANVVPFCWI